MKQSIIILHGWGLNGSKYNELSKILKNKGFDVYLPDLPGFGQESLKSESMNLDNYVDFVNKLIKQNKIEKPIIIGHSFGGRVGIKYSYIYPDNVSKLILTGVPVIRHITFKKRIVKVMAIAGHLFFDKAPGNINSILRKILYQSIGEWDYYKSGSLKEVFKNIIKEDLLLYAKELIIPTLLVWGEDDKLVPVSDVVKIKKIIQDANFVIIPNVGHKLPYEKPELFFDSIKSFIS